MHTDPESSVALSSSVAKAKPKVIVLSGPTASGKTELAVELAHQLKGEIISADSMQVYKGMDIGTAKVSFEEARGVPHHLIDICDLKQPFNVVDYCREATAVIFDILRRGKVPIIAGGTGFYIHCLIYGAPEGPPSSGPIRSKLQRELERLGNHCLHERLEELDPDYADTVSPNDTHKIIRALEIIALTGHKVSDFSKFREKGVVVAPFEFHCYFLHFPKEVLYHRIEQRCDRMVEMGFLSEVKALLEVGLRSNLSASQAIGYKQAIEYLESNQSPDDWEYFLDEFKKSSRKYAKRQFTWFRKEPLFQWLDRELLSKGDIIDLIIKNYSH